LFLQSQAGAYRAGGGMTSLNILSGGAAQGLVGSLAPAF
jgi:hypothetical protein